MNEDKNGKIGYIGYEAYAELLFGLSQKLIYNLWLKLGWIKLYREEK